MEVNNDFVIECPECGNKFIVDCDTCGYSIEDVLCKWNMEHHDNSCSWDNNKWKPKKR